MDLNRHPPDSCRAGLPGETPLDDYSGLIPKDVRTVAQLSVVEIQNSAMAVTKYLSRRPTKRMAPFTRQWMLRLHGEMFGEVWSWAGEVRTSSGLNVGVEAHRIASEMELLAQDTAYWAEHGGDAMEQAGAIHHRSVYIHPFLNGNGRWARLLGQIWQYRKLGFYTEWPEAEMWHGLTPLREEYINALKEADRGNLESLLDLQRRFTPTLRDDL